MPIKTSQFPSLASLAFFLHGVEDTCMSGAGFHHRPEQEVSLGQRPKAMEKDGNCQRRMGKAAEDGLSLFLIH